MELFLTLRQQFVFNSDVERGTEPLSSEWPKRGSEHGGNPPPYRSASQIRELSAPKGPYRDMAIGSVRCVEASSRYPQKKKKYSERRAAIGCLRAHCRNKRASRICLVRSSVKCVNLEISKLLEDISLSIAQARICLFSQVLFRMYGFRSLTA